MSIESSNHSDIKRKASGSLFWNLFEKAGIQALSFVVGIIMTRILLPSDYGTIALLEIFTAGGLILANSGFGQAYIREDATHEQQSSIFYVNVGIGIFLYSLLFAGAPVLARFFELPILTEVTAFFSLILPIQAAASFYQFYLIRSFLLKKLALIRIFSLLVAGTLGIYLSLSGYGVWALVYYFVVYFSLNLLQLIFFSGWKPAWSFEIAYVKKIFPFSSRIAAAELVDSVYTNYLTLLVGKFYDVRTTGFYSKSRMIQNIPVITATQAIQSVSYPLFSRLKESAHETMDAFGKQVRMLSYVLSGIIGIMIVSADTFVEIVFTEKWLPMVPYFRLLCVIGWLVPMQVLHSSFLNSAGRSGLSLKLELSKKSAALLLALLCLPYGIEIILVSQISVMSLGLLLSIYFSLRVSGYNIAAQMKDHFTCLTLMVISGLAAYYVAGFIESVYFRFLLSVFCTAGVYIILSFAARASQHRQILSIVSNRNYSDSN